MSEICTFYQFPLKILENIIQNDDTVAKYLPADEVLWKTKVLSLGQEDPLK